MSSEDHGPDPDEVDRQERLFPVDVSTLGRRAKWIWGLNQHPGRPLPGEFRFHTHNVMPAKVYPWPDSTSIDQQMGRSITKQWGYVVPTDTVFLVITSNLHDHFGNEWCYVLGAGRLGWVHGNSLVTQEEFNERHFVVLTA